MAPEIAERAQQINSGKSRKEWRWTKALSQADYRPAMRGARCVQVFLDAGLVGRYNYLAQQVRDLADIEPDALEPGQVILLVNKAKTSFAMLLPDKNVLFHTPADRISLHSFDAVAEAFQAQGIEYDTALKRLLLNVIEGRTERDVTSGSMGTLMRPKDKE